MEFQPRPPADHRSSDDVHVDVAVIGGGYAGLSAALALVDAGITDVAVLEGSDRIGGRTLSETRQSGVVIDHGGQWVGPKQTRLLAVAKRFGISTFPTYYTGDHLEMWSDGQVRRYRGAGPDDSPGIGEYAQHVATIDALAGTIDTSNPAASPNAALLDAETVATYLHREVDNADARLRFALAVQGVWACEPDQLSMLHFLFYIASAGSFDELMETEGCAQDSRFEGGAQGPALAMAAYLGDRVKTGCRVMCVEHGGTGARLHCSGSVVHARRVIVALPPQAMCTVLFDPVLPVNKARFVDRSIMGDVAKVHLIYDTPFWRTAGLSGTATLYGEPETGVVFDNSPNDGSFGVLVAFIYGRRLAPWLSLSDNARREAVVDTMTRLFGDPAAEFSDYTEKIWPVDPWIRGAYAATPTPGTWTNYGADGWRNAAGILHWAGTETASQWNGYIDGAISSGQRAADEVLRAL